MKLFSWIAKSLLAIPVVNYRTRHWRNLFRSIRKYRKRRFFDIMREDRFLSIHGFRLRRDPLATRKSRAFKLLLEKMDPVIMPGGRIQGRQTIFSFPYYLYPKEFGSVRATGNVTPDYGKVLRLGLTGIRKQALERLGRTESPEEKDFLEAVVRSLEASVFFSRRYASKLRERARSERGEDAGIVEKVPAEPAQTFHEAVQSVYFTNLLLWIEGHNLVGLGRFDQYLYPYFRSDMDAGRLSLEEARAVLVDFWRAMNRDNDRRSNMLPGDTGQVVTIGGVTPEGEDASNELSYLTLDVVEELRPIDPKIVLRVHGKTPDRLVRRGVELLGRGLGYPLFLGDELNVSAMVNDGYRLRDARDYSTSACWEPLVPGASFDQNNLGNIIFLHALEAALNHGNSIDDGTRIGPDYGGIEEYPDFARLLDAVKKEISYLLGKEVEEIQKVEFEISPFLSSIMDGCIERGRDVSQGGCQYNNFGFLSASISNTADALAAIREHVFENARVSPAEIIPILRSNFEGREEIVARLRYRSPKFGNDDDRVDLIVRDLAIHYAEELARYRNRFGGSHRPGFGSSDLYITASRRAAASFDGRMRGDFFASNFSPAIGSERKGPTAVIQSILKTDLARVYNGTVLDMKFSPSLFAHERNLDKIVSLVRTFVSLGGQQLQVNVVDTVLLKEAQKDPERYRDLIVRVWGFSAYFVELPREYQDHLIARSELSTW